MNNSGKCEGRWGDMFPCAPIANGLLDQHEFVPVWTQANGWVDSLNVPGQPDSAPTEGADSEDVLVGQPTNQLPGPGRRNAGRTIPQREAINNGDGLSARIEADITVPVEKKPEEVETEEIVVVMEGFEGGRVALDAKFFLTALVYYVLLGVFVVLILSTMGKLPYHHMVNLLIGVILFGLIFQLISVQVGWVNTLISGILFVAWFLVSQVYLCQLSKARNFATLGAAINLVLVVAGLFFAYSHGQRFVRQASQDV